MSKLPHRLTVCMTLAVGLVLFSSLTLPGQDHVVSSADLHQALASAAQTREHQRQQLQQFFSSPAARRALKRARVDETQVTKAVASLNDHELARLSSRAQKVQQDFAAGALTNEQLTYIIIALATAVIIIIIFKA
jgi:hypothetical protein